MDHEFDLALDKCLDRLKSGCKLEECLRNYPQFAPELAPLLKASDELYSLNSFTPSETAKRKGQARLQQTINEIDRKYCKPKESLFQWLIRQPKLCMSLATSLLVIFLVVGLANAFLGATNDGPANSIVPSISSKDTAPPSITANSGVLEIRVTDAPAYDISAVNVTIGDIEVHRVNQGNAPKNQGSDAETEWEMAIEESKSFELLELRGIDAVLDSIEFGAGQYDHIRMNIEEVMVTVDGETHNVKLSDDQFKLTGPFEIEEGIRTVLTMDFDAAKSVIVTDEGKVMFEPAVTVDVAYKPENVLVDESDGDQPIVLSDSQSVVPTKPQPDFSIFVNRIEINEDETFTAYFGYFNYQDTNLVLSQSKLCPMDGAVIGNPPSILLAGRHDKVFAATAPAGTEIVWTAGTGNRTKSSTASSIYAN